MAESGEAVRRSVLHGLEGPGYVGGGGRRGNTGNRGGGQTSVSGRGKGSNERQETRVARTDWRSTAWAKETQTSPLQNSLA